MDAMTYALALISSEQWRWAAKASAHSHHPVFPSLGPCERVPLHRLKLRSSAFTITLPQPGNSQRASKGCVKGPNGRVGAVTEWKPILKGLWRAPPA
jgi:hypothetical protein